MSSGQSWTRELTKYHWFVLIVAALGWLFDTMDQQLFNLARMPAMNELLAPSPGTPPAPGDVNKYGGIATAVFLMGWASGGLFFGMLGDRIGRARTMMWTILLYSLCTGLSALSVGFWDFAFYRFLTGLGVGGEFAVGVALVAEVMPPRARPFALALLQALSAVGNLTAAFVSIGLGHLEQSGVLGQFNVLGVQITAWRAMFVVGTFPALLALVIRRRLKEPEQWQAATHSSTKRLGSYAELFGDPRWRKRAIVGVVMATSGVIALWGIGFFSIDLNRSVFRKVFEQEARKAGQGEWDRDLLRLAVREPELIGKLKETVRPNDLLGPSGDAPNAQQIWAAMIERHDKGESVAPGSWLEQLTPKSGAGANMASLEAYLEGNPDVSNVDELLKKITDRAKDINGRLTAWAGYTSMMMNIGAFFGIYGFGLMTQRIGRRPAFAISFLAAGASTVLVFGFLDSLGDVFWMIPLMGFCQLSLFGGYAIYFPELFPTRLRSTGTSFCYNVGRFVAASGPFTLGLLTSEVFGAYPEPMRYAGLTMCSVFLIGLLALPFAPETKDEPLPE